jgi:hypothetical protein
MNPASTTNDPMGDPCHTFLKPQEVMPDIAGVAGGYLDTVVGWQDRCLTRDDPKRDASVIAKARKGGLIASRVEDIGVALSGMRKTALV